MNTGWKVTGLIACGFALGTAGVKLLSSKDAKKCYAHVTAAVLRCKDAVMKQSSILKENCQDIAEDAKDINEKRYEAEREQEIADAKEIVESAKEESADEENSYTEAEA